MKRAKELRRKIRHFRIRKRIVGTSQRPRICVHKTLKHLYVSVVDDMSQPDKGCLTLVNMTTTSKDNKSQEKKSFCNIPQAKILGQAVGKALLEKGIKNAVFDRAGYLYHGCIKAIAESIREVGVTI